MTKEERIKRALQAKAEKRHRREREEREARETIASYMAGTSWPSERGTLQPMSSTERSKRFRAKGREIGPIPPPRHRRVRESCRYDPLRFGLIYCTDKYEGMSPLLKRPPSPRMVKFIVALRDVVLYGGLKHVRWPRGKGKTTWVKVVAMWAALYGHKHFFTVVEKIKAMGREVVDEIWNRVRLSPKIAADFPEFSVPMRDVALAPQRMRFQTCMGRPTRMKMDINGGYYRFPTIEGYPNTGAIIAYRGVDQALRGINVESTRPDFFFIDDPQTDEDARNAETVAKIEDNIQGGILGSGEISERISTVMASTPIEPDDVSERFADPKRHPEWHTETERFVVRWGDEALRDEYLALLAADHAQEDATLSSSRKFYMEHREEIERGVEMMDDGDFNPANEVSAYQHALWLLDTMKHKRFFSEMQMEPRRDESVVNITPKLVLSRIRRGTLAAQVPEGTLMVCLATDINPSYALTCAAVAFDAVRTAMVIDHWRHPCRLSPDLNDTEFHNAIYTLLADVAASLDARGLDPASRDFHWAIDASGAQFPAVTRFVHDRRRDREHPLDVFALRGLDNKMFNPRVKTRKFKEVPGRNDTVLVLDELTRREHVNFNKDKYELTAQRAWLSAVGAPGGLSLYDRRAGGATESHEEFALQVCGEQLKWKPPDPDRDRVGFKWNERVYHRHDYGDCVYMCYALAGFLGLAAEGAAAVRPVRKRRAFIGGKMI